MKMTLPAWKISMAAHDPVFVIGLLILFALFLLALSYFVGGRKRHRARELILARLSANPILGPIPGHWWESQAVFNPAAVVHDGRVHLLYRALGNDGVSRVGYASSADGIHFDERHEDPVYAAEEFTEAIKHHPYTSPARLVYDTQRHASGGGWGGCEDPRAVKLDGRIYMTFNMFNGWESMRTAVTSIKDSHFSEALWAWEPYEFLSRPGERQKNWVLFPEKINGKFALFHNLDKGNPKEVHIAYMETLTMDEAPWQHEAPDPQQLPDHHVGWHNRTRSAACPPIKTSEGWLLLYHAMDKNDPGKYKVGALLLDLNAPEKVLYRSETPVLEPREWYENDWKPGIVYASGGVAFGDELFVYYGGGDKYIAGAHANLHDFISRLKTHRPLELSPLAV